jgi:hypothetical protein
MTAAMDVERATTLREPLFKVSNHHAEAGGEPPAVDGDATGTYFGSFTNGHTVSRTAKGRLSKSSTGSNRRWVAPPAHSLSPTSPAGAACSPHGLYALAVHMTGMLS